MVLKKSIWFDILSRFPTYITGPITHPLTVKSRTYDEVLLIDMKARVYKSSRFIVFISWVYKEGHLLFFHFHSLSAKLKTQTCRLYRVDKSWLGILFARWENEQLVQKCSYLWVVYDLFFCLYFTFKPLQNDNRSGCGDMNYGIYTVLCFVSIIV